MSARQNEMGETLLGAIVIAIAVGFLFFAVTRAGAGENAGGYSLKARFNRVDGVAVGSDVRLAGVKVGAVSTVAVDPETYNAVVTFTVDPKVKIPDDSAARIQSDGLLGGAYLSVEPGGSATKLQPGAEVLNTQGSVDLLTLFASFANQGGAQKKPEETQP